jgi:cytoskeleton protein RodZ
MESLGEFLKKGREEASLSLETLAQRTRIRIENLEALEREDLDALPTDIYVRGFVKLVCRELALAPEDGLVRYDALRSAAGPPDEIIWSEDVETSEPGWLDRALRDPERAVRVGKSALRWGGVGIGGILVVTLVVAGARWLGDRAETSPSPAVASQTEAPATAEATPPASKPKPVELALVDPEISEPEPERREAVRPAPAQPAVKPAARATEAGEPVREPVRAPAPRPAAPAVRMPRGSSEPLVLVVEALRPVEVEVLLDGVGSPRTKRLAAGERKTWKADNVFLLSATDGGAIRLTLDGVNLGAPGPEGEPLLHASVTPQR